MAPKANLGMTRRSFIKTSGMAGAAIGLNPKLNLMAAEVCPVRTDLGVNPTGGSGIPYNLLNFAQVSDIHITDTTNPLRAKALDSIASPATRPQEHLSVKTWEATIKSINAEIENEKLSFLISTGDQVDNALEHEVKWLIDAADGSDPDQTYKALEGTRPNDQSTVKVPSLEPEAINMPWYLALGNHDVMVIGNFNVRFIEEVLGGFMDLLKQFDPQWDFNLTDLGEYIDTVQRSQTESYWSRFEGMSSDGYYSFSPNPYTHCIVLNTTNDNWLEGLSDAQGKSITKGYLEENSAKLIKLAANLKAGNDPQMLIDQLLEQTFADFSSWADKNAYRYGVGQTKCLADNDGMIGGLSQGTLDKPQYEWMVGEILSNQDKLVMVFSHHGPDSFLTPPGNIGPNQFIETLQEFDNVIAHIHGHTHYNLIEPSFGVKTLDLGKPRKNGGYWDITTNSLAEYPMEWRRIRIIDDGNGCGRICCQMHEHAYDTGYEVAKADPQAKDELDTMYGDDLSRNVDLIFAMPERVQQNISLNPPSTKESAVSAEDIANATAIYANDTTDQRCFVATAAFGSSMEPEVLSLRRYRDQVLKQTKAGRIFIQTYYRLSPPLARLIANDPILKSLSRSVLRPIIALLKLQRKI